MLALDLATRTGWAVGEPCGLPVYGSFNLVGACPGAKFLLLARTATRLIMEHGVTDVVLEAAHTGGKGRPEVLFALLGYRAIAMMAAEAKGIPCTAEQPSTIRRAFIGHGRLGRKSAKAAVTEKCQWLGLAPRNDDEADAIALLFYRLTCASSAHFAMMLRRGSFGSIGEVSHASALPAPLPSEGGGTDRP